MGKHNGHYYEEHFEQNALRCYFMQRFLYLIRRNPKRCLCYLYTYRMTISLVGWYGNAFLSTVATEGVNKIRLATSITLNQALDNNNCVQHCPLHIVKLNTKQQQKCTYTHIYINSMQECIPMPPSRTSPNSQNRNGVLLWVTELVVPLMPALECPVYTHTQ